eukprot:TRINITY_DN2659_c0_g1_i1.p1 TRINITY_DN2659_c0_g1~~TRINITY_DN2659_c0_g1_i1.p1  ORF type:complete len:814 (-),score=96.05 TRINITY_DN2659_c0_g1_i1:25-2466(-)
MRGSDGVVDRFQNMQVENDSFEPGCALKIRPAIPSVAAQNRRTGASHRSGYHFETPTEPVVPKATGTYRSAPRRVHATYVEELSSLEDVHRCARTRSALIRARFADAQVAAQVNYDALWAQLSDSERCVIERLEQERRRCLETEALQTVQAYVDDAGQNWWSHRCAAVKQQELVHGSHFMQSRETIESDWLLEILGMMTEHERVRRMAIEVSQCELHTKLIEAMARLKKIGNLVLELNQAAARTAAASKIQRWYRHRRRIVSQRHDARILAHTRSARAAVIQARKQLEEEERIAAAKGEDVTRLLHLEQQERSTIWHDQEKERAILVNSWAGMLKRQDAKKYFEHVTQLINSERDGRLDILDEEATALQSAEWWAASRRLLNNSNISWRCLMERATVLQDEFDDRELWEHAEGRHRRLLLEFREDCERCLLDVTEYTEWQRIKRTCTLEFAKASLLDAVLQVRSAETAVRATVIAEWEAGWHAIVAQAPANRKALLRLQLAPYAIRIQCAWRRHTAVETRLRRSRAFRQRIFQTSLQELFSLEEHERAPVFLEQATLSRQIFTQELCERELLSRGRLEREFIDSTVQLKAEADDARAAALQRSRKWRHQRAAESIQRWWRLQTQRLAARESRKTWLRRQSAERATPSLPRSATPSGNFSRVHSVEPPKFTPQASFTERARTVAKERNAIICEEARARSEIRLDEASSRCEVADYLEQIGPAKRQRDKPVEPVAAVAPQEQPQRRQSWFLRQLLANEECPDPLSRTARPPPVPPHYPETGRAPRQLVAGDVMRQRRIELELDEAEQRRTTTPGM